VGGVTFTTRGALNKSALRQANERLVLNAVRQNPSISRADIARVTALSPSSVSYILKRLLREKLISEEPVVGHSQVGRRPTALFVRPEARMAVGAEIARSGARVALADLNGKIVRCRSVAWHANPDIYFDRVRSIIRSLVERLPPERVLGVGVGMPGFIERTSGRVVAENLGWFDVAAGATLRRDLPFPFHYENSAKLSALAEMWSSEQAGKRLHDFVYVTANGGVGTGAITHGQLLQGNFCAASEFGHITLFADGRPCACGGTGCWEQYAADFALCRLYAELGGTNGNEAVEMNASEVVRKARESHPVARRALEETARYAAIGFTNLIWALNPEALVVGGWLAEAWDLIEGTVWKTIRRRVPAYNLRGVRIFPSQHAADAPLLGAIALVLTRYFTSINPGIDARRARSHETNGSGETGTNR
jgi:predicted NBD/HSP70 family sugar kinase